MRRWSRVTVIAAGALVSGSMGAALLGTWLWDRATNRMIERLADGVQEPAYESVSPEVFSDLPAPVARYFEFALPRPGPRVRSARIEHTGEFRGSLRARWSPFRSIQHISANPPKFVWDARIRMAPLVDVHVRDSYIGGRASMLGRVAALVPVVDQQGTPELASGALHRYLAEAVWLPTALLPREGVTWEAVDDSTARVSLSDSGITVSLEAHFGASGEIVRVEAERYRDVDGVGVLTPFVGHFRDYAEVDGMQIPMEGEAQWILPEGVLSYWKARIDRIGYDLAR